MRLPLSRAEDLRLDAGGPRGDEPAESALDLLVVEDNRTNRLVPEELLRQLGHSVTLAADGTEGVRLAQARRFDAVLMDISTPVMDGLTRLIRAEGPSRGSRILAVTAHTLPADLVQFRAAGMDGSLTKPTTGAELTRALRIGEPAPKAAAATAEAAPLLDTGAWPGCVWRWASKARRTQFNDIFPTWTKFSPTSAAPRMRRGSGPFATQPPAYRPPSGRLRRISIIAAERTAATGDHAKAVESLRKAEHLCGRTAALMRAA